MLEEIHLMTDIEDLSHTIRNPEVCAVKAKELKKKYLVNEGFSIINEEVLQLTI